MNRRELNRRAVPLGESARGTGDVGYVVLYVPPYGESITGTYYMAEDGRRVYELDLDDALMYITGAEYSVYKNTAAFAFMHKDKIAAARRWRDRPEIREAHTAFWAAKGIKK